MLSPLADRVRPETIDEVVGQKHLLAENKVLYNIISAGVLPNLIFYGPSGVGKTTVANILAKATNKRLYHLNATVASTADIKEIINSLDSIESQSGVLLYLDEIQYFNKKQQQILLSYIENGDITLIASTTENPFFYVYGAILSRSTVLEFKPLDAFDIKEALLRAALKESQTQNRKIVLNEETAFKIARSANGDARRALNTLDLCILSHPSGDLEITDSEAEEILKNNAVRYDRDGDEHYDIVSAYQKSMRGSDPDAALHYLARLLAAGDLPSACRRLMVCACEDVGLAYPQIIPIVKAAVDAALSLGLPEARIPLADAVILVATSPKSNSGCIAIDSAINDVENGMTGPVPRNLQNKHCDGADNETPGQNYLYPHNFENHYVRQQYLPDKIKNRRYYAFGDNKTEQKFKEYNDFLKKQK